ncbi:hypothetical protein Q9L58_010322, partial [Maublancomyces gigas]
SHVHVPAHRFRYSSVRITNPTHRNICGKNIIVRDVAEKVLTWVDKFKLVGDIASQADSAHTALHGLAFDFYYRFTTLD